MSELIIIAFETEAAAKQARNALATLQQAAGTKPEDIVLVVRKATGDLRVGQTILKATGKPLGDGRWGMLIASLFLDERDPVKHKGPGLARTFRKTGLDVDFIRDVSRSLASGGAAVGMRLSALSTKAVTARLAGLADPGRVMRTTLNADVEANLEAMRDVIPEVAHTPSVEAG